MIMCNNDEFIKLVTDYVLSVLDEKVTLVPLEKCISDTIPIAVTQSFNLYKVELLGHAVVFALTHDGNEISPAQLKRTFNLIEHKCECPVVLVTDNIASYNVGRLTSQRSNFIIPKKQMFIPSLLIDLKKAKATGIDIKETIPPMAQCLLLYNLEIKSIDRCETKDLMEIFQVSYATMPFLVSPVEKIAFSDFLPSGSLKCGINALSEYTLINEENSDMYAINRTDMHQSDIPINKEYGLFRIEIWKYDPKLLSHTGTVDKLSLYLSLKDNDDERVQIELDNLLNDIQW